MATTVTIRSKPSSPTVRLEVTYSGLEPPVALFDDLAMVGWSPPPIPPPPATAIDWTRPDPNTGQRFTIADYQVEAAVVDPPRGSGPLGRWNDADRRAHLAVLEGVLRRHDLLDQVQDIAARPPASPDRSTRPAVAPPSEPASDPVPAGTVRATAPVAASAEAAVATALAGAGVRALSFTPVHRTVVHRYRGAEQTQQVLDHLRLEVVADRSAVDRVREAVRRATSATGAPAPEIAITAGPEPPDEAAGIPQLRAVADVRSA